MPAVTTGEHRARAGLVRRLLTAHRQGEDLIRIGAYKPGMDVELDAALKALPMLRKYMEQGSDEAVTLTACVDRLLAMSLA